MLPTVQPTEILILPSFTCSYIDGGVVLDEGALKLKGLKRCGGSLRRRSMHWLDNQFALVSNKSSQVLFCFSMEECSPNSPIQLLCFRTTLRGSSSSTLSYISKPISQHPARLTYVNSNHRRSTPDGFDSRDAIAFCPERPHKEIAAWKYLVDFRVWNISQDSNPISVPPVLGLCIPDHSQMNRPTTTTRCPRLLHFAVSQSPRQRVQSHSWE